MRFQVVLHDVPDLLLLLSPLELEVELLLALDWTRREKATSQRLNVDQRRRPPQRSAGTSATAADVDEET